jgi:asparagine synthase (glutamine-hydrolysing)
VVALMSAASTTPIRTFSIGFDNVTYNELPYARLVAAHFGADHAEEILKPDIADLAEHLVGYLDEPFADFSLFPTYLVSKLATNSVKVVLSGDGGDELFGGYDT